MSTWTDWTSCSLTSEQCQKTRSRTCDQGCDDVTNEDLEQTQNCNDVDCGPPQGKNWGYNLLVTVCN